MLARETQSEKDIDILYSSVCESSQNTHAVYRKQALDKNRDELKGISEHKLKAAMFRRKAQYFEKGEKSTR